MNEKKFRTIILTGSPRPNLENLLREAGADILAVSENVYETLRSQDPFQLDLIVVADERNWKDTCAEIAKAWRLPAFLVFPEGKTPNLADSWGYDLSGCVNEGESSFEAAVAEAALRTQSRRGGYDDKDMLLREILHRVKNNFQVIISLLTLQESSIGDAQRTQELKTAENRIRAIALVHEKLYKSESFTHIDFAHYLRSLVSELAGNLGPRARSIRIQLAVSSVQIGLEEAVPCGLIANELITNAYKHAFPENLGREPEITVALSENEGSIRLLVRDNGIGLPPGVTPDSAKSLGLSIVNMLSIQIGGGLHQQSSKSGTSFTLSFERVNIEKNEITP